MYKYLLDKPRVAFHFLVVLIGSLILYTSWLFIYLKITGVYAVATISGGVATSEGVDYRYEFYYLGEQYGGVFTDLRRELGSKYFVSFSKSDPSKNLLQYNHPVPDCLKDSIFTFWDQMPECSTTKSSK